MTLRALLYIQIRKSHQLFLHMAEPKACQWRNGGKRHGAE